MRNLPTITLERLQLRPFQLHDADSVQQLAGDPYIAEMTLYIPHPYKNGMAEEWIRTHDNQFIEGKSVTLAIVHKEESYLIGAITVALHNNFNHGELAYWIGVPFMNKGYCTEAARGMMAYAFDELKLNRVYARHLGKNPASGKVMEKLGMKFEGCLRQHVIKGDTYEDLAYYGLLQEEYLTERRSV